jgi:hypothetical protein
MERWLSMLLKAEDVIVRWIPHTEDDMIDVVCAIIYT